MATIRLLIVACLITSTFAAIYTCDRTAQCGCTSVAPTSSVSRIIGGEAVQNRTWGWIVSLQWYRSHRCAASLISAEYAVTAAHCVEDVLQNMQHLTILAGTNYLSVTSGSSVQRRTVTAIHVHPNYDPDKFTNDIAVIRFLPLTMGSTSSLSFICLPNSNQDPFADGSNLIAIGWGVTSEYSYTASDSLQQVTVQAVASTSADCRRVPIEDSTVQFCAGLSAGGKDTCQGDSGGPLMAFSNNRWILAGITSSGYGCALAGYPGLYTRVSRFISYIQSIVGTVGTSNTTRLTSTSPTTTTATPTRGTSSTTRPTTATTAAKVTSSTPRMTTRSTTRTTVNTGTRPTTRTTTVPTTTRSTVRTATGTGSRSTTPTTNVPTTTRSSARTTVSTVTRPTTRTTTVPTTTRSTVRTTTVTRLTTPTTTAPTTQRTTVRSSTSASRPTTTIPKNTTRSTTARKI